MFLKLMTTIFMLALTSSSVLAKDCQSEQSAIDIADCHMARYALADKEMNRIFNVAMKSLSGDTKVKLKDAQKAWLKYRDASFAFVIELNKNNRSYGNNVVADYKAKLVEKRVQEMKYLLAGPADSPVAW